VARKSKTTRARESSGRSYDRDSPDLNAKEIASGNLQVLVDYLWDLGRTCLELQWHSVQNKSTGEERALFLMTQALFYSKALAASAYVASRGRGQPRKYFTTSEAFRALQAAADYEAQLQKGERTTKVIERDILRRYNITRGVLRAAVAKKLPKVDHPGIPRAEK
jgi:hypothetical protein